MNKKQFSTILKSARKEKGISKCKLADLTGFTRQAIHKWEKGEESISLENADKLLKTLGVEMMIGEKAAAGRRGGEDKNGTDS